MARLLRYFTSATAMALLSIGSAGAATLKTLYSVSGSSDGAVSVAGLIYESGIVYGTTTLGGAKNAGTVFALNTVTGRERVLDNFGTEASLISFNGMLYGISSGTVFSINPSNGAEKVISNIGGFSGAPLTNEGGILFGTIEFGGIHNNGMVFSVNPTTGDEKIVYSFTGGNDGRGPYGGLVDLGGTLYGTTHTGGAANAGTVFSLDPATGSEKVLYSFANGKDGAGPQAALVAVGGVLYGTTNVGGVSTNGSVSNQGTVFAFNPTTGAERVLHGFGGSANADGSHPTDALVDVGGTLFGTTVSGGAFGDGTVFSIDPATGVEKVLHSFKGSTEGSRPAAELIYAGGELYGTTSTGGPNGEGTVFTVNPTNGAEKTFYGFTAMPTTSSNNLLNVNGSLFLSTSGGGADSYGDIVKITPATGVATEIYEFVGGASGANPSAPLISVGGNMLYGTTRSGGAIGDGTVFSVNPATGAEVVLHSFAGGKDGAFPAAALIDLRGVLYGTTQQGGIFNYGTVFSINPTLSGGGDTVLHSFAGSPDGANPTAALINVGGQLYGTTEASLGTVYIVNPATGAEKVLYNFKNHQDGEMPAAPLLYVGGTLYGATIGSDVAGHGAVFAINPGTGAERVIYYVGSQAALTYLGGKLYGVGDNAVFSIDVATGAETQVYGFTGGSDGGSPNAALVSIGGILYGTTSTGGANGRGTVFELTP